MTPLLNYLPILGLRPLLRPPPQDKPNSMPLAMAHITQRAPAYVGEIGVGAVTADELEVGTSVHF